MFKQSRLLLSWLIIGIITILAVPLAVWAVNDVTTDDATVSLNLTSTGYDYTLASGNTVQSFTVGPSSMTFVAEASSSFTLTSTNRSDFTLTGVNGCTTSITCGASTSVLSVTCDSGDPEQTIVVTPFGTCAMASGSGSSGGGGGGGGTVDTTAPTNTSVVIAGGAASVASTVVSLTLGATGASYVMISNSSAFTGATWVSYATSFDWTLSSGDGTKTVYAKFKDAAGNVSSVVSDTITLLGDSTTTTDTEEDTGESAETLPGASESTEETTSCSLTAGGAYKYAGSSAVYYVTDDCAKRAFKHADTYFTYFSSWSAVETVAQTMLESISDDSLGFMPKGPLYDPKYGALVKTTDDPKVYLLLGTEKYWITDADIFNTLNYQWTWIEDVSDLLLDEYTVGSEINYTDHHPNYTIVKYADSSKVYRLEPDLVDDTQQVKRWIVDSATFDSLNFRWDRIVMISVTEQYTDGNDLQNILGTKITDTDYVFTQFLQQGSQGEEVKQLQLKLQSLGFFSQDTTANAYFGSATEDAVKKFQIAKGIASLGYVGPATREALNAS